MIHLAVHLTHPRLGKKLPKEITTTAWGFDAMSVSDALRSVADKLDGTPVESVTVWVERTDRDSVRPA